MSDKILVTYATYAGSTAGVAEAIGKTLVENGAVVDVVPMSEVDGVAPYTAVVAGSAIQGRDWLPEGMQFIQDHQSDLKRKPFAAFMVCMTMVLSGGEYVEEAKVFMQPVRALVKPVKEGYFAGALDLSKVPSFRDRLGFRISIALRIWSEGDFRDWDAIRTWSEELIPLLEP